MGMVRSGMSVQAQSTDGRDYRIRARRWSGWVDDGIYQTTEFSDKCLQKTGAAVWFRLTLRGLPYILVGMLRARKNSKRRATRLRDPEHTRERLLQAASREVYRTGFQSAGLDTILASTGVTKGALYYHFKSKEALGYAIVEEIVEEITRDRWVRPLQRSKDKDAIDALIGIVRAIPLGQKT